MSILENGGSYVEGNMKMYPKYFSLIDDLNTPVAGQAFSNASGRGGGMININLHNALIGVHVWMEMRWGHGC